MRRDETKEYIINPTSNEPNESNWRGGTGTSICPRIFDQNESCSKSYLNPMFFCAKSATLKFCRLTVTKHNKIVKKVVFCIVWRHTVSKPYVAQHWVLAHSKQRHFYYMNHQRTFHFRLFENLQDFFFKGLKNTLKTYDFSSIFLTFLNYFSDV